MTKPDFKLVAEHKQEYGHCQLTYETRNKYGQRIYYCLQDNHGIELLRCTQDGEPSHGATLKGPVEFELPEINNHDSNYVIELKVKCMEWIESHPFTNLTKEPSND